VVGSNFLFVDTISDLQLTIPELIVGLADRDIDVRKAMVACLLVTEPTVPDLLPLLTDKNANVRESVADALIQIDPDASVIVPELALALVGSNLGKKNVDDIKAMVDCLAQCIIQQHSQSLSEQDLRFTATVNKYLSKINCIFCSEIFENIFYVLN
jgi:hypothetical protein